MPHRSLDTLFRSLAALAVCLFAACTSENRVYCDEAKPCDATAEKSSCDLTRNECVAPNVEVDACNNSCTTAEAPYCDTDTRACVDCLGNQCDPAAVTLPVPALGLPKLWHDAKEGYLTVDSKPQSSVQDWRNQGSLIGVFANEIKAEQPRYVNEELEFRNDLESNLVSTFAKAETRFLHDGSGSTIAIAFKRGNTLDLGEMMLIDSHNNAAYSPGFSLGFDSSNGDLSFRIGSSDSWVIAKTVLAVVDDTDEHVVVARFDNSRLDNSWSLSLDGVMLSEGENVVGRVPDAVDATDPLTLGLRSSSPGLALEARVRSIIAYDSYIQDDEVSALTAFMLQLPVPEIGTPRLWFTPQQRFLAIDSQDSPTVGEWRNRGSIIGAFINALKDTQPRYQDVSIEFRHDLETKLTGTHAKAETRFLHDGTGATIAIAFRRLDLVNHGQMTLIDSHNNSPIQPGMGLGYDSSNGDLWYRIGASSSWIVAQTELGVVNDVESHVVVARFDHTRQDHHWSLYLDGVKLSEGNAVADRVPDANDAPDFLTLGGRSLTPDFYLEAQLHGIIAYDSYVTNQQMDSLVAYLAALASQQ